MANFERANKKLFGIFAGLLGVILAIAFWLFNQGEFDDVLYEETPRAVDDLPYEDPWGIDWQYWKSVNPDVVGWIVVDDTVIDYPIVQAHADDPEYYLEHDIKGKRNRMGVPFVSANCKGLNDTAVWIYGHHFVSNINGRKGKMFTALSNMTKTNWAKSHTIHILMPTDDLKHTRELNTAVSCARIVNARSAREVAGFNTGESATKWLKDEYDASKMKLNFADDANGFIALVTCSYTTYKNERTISYLQVT